ncbi:MAG: SagB/ThcOx family dehydrogenase [Thermomicrobiales bacterium]
MAQHTAPVETIQHFLLATDHAPDRLDDQYAGTLDPALRPRPDKRYPTLAPLPLPAPTAFMPSRLPALAAIADSGEGRTIATGTLDLGALARIAFFTNGITKWLRAGDQALAFRAAPTTGALYHIEVYLVTSDLPGLPAGVYHYGAHDHALRQLRAGDYRASVIAATGDEPAIAQAPVIMVMTSVFWRNAWKYAARAYRHAYWDAGTMLPNTLAVAAAAQIPARLVLSFADEPIAKLLGLDLDREGIIALVALGRAESTPPPAPPVTELNLRTEPYSVREIEFPLIRATHRATLLETGDEAARWREQTSRLPAKPTSRAPLIALPTPATDLPSDPIETVIRRRGSTRRFAREPITLAQLSALLDSATHGVPSDTLGPDGIPFNTLYVFVNAVDGLQPGTYVYHRAYHALEPLQVVSESEAREMTYDLALEQDLGGDAAVNIYLLSDLDPTLATLGARGYRLAQLGGALVAGKLYLAAYALGLGATGLTFFDQAATDTFSPHAVDQRVMFLIAIGIPPRV